MHVAHRTRSRSIRSPVPSTSCTRLPQTRSGAFTSGRTRMVDGKQPFSSVLELKITSQQTGHKTSGVGWVNIQKAYGFECKRRTTSTITIDSNTHVNYFFYRSSDDPTACTSKKQTLVTISPTAKDSGVVLDGRM